MTMLSSVQYAGRPEQWSADMVYIGMPGKAARAFGIEDASVPGFGKPWSCLSDPRGWMTAYREYLWRRLNSDAEFRSAVRKLDGKTLLCWCTAKAKRQGKPVVCHGQVLIKAIEWLKTQE